MTIDLDYLQSLCDAATEGPWHVANNNLGYVHGPAVRIAEVGDYNDDELLPYCKDRWDADRVLIAEARTAIPELISEVRRLRDKAGEA